MKPFFVVYSFLCIWCVKNKMKSLEAVNKGNIDHQHAVDCRALHSIKQCLQSWQSLYTAGEWHNHICPVPETSFLRDENFSHVSHFLISPSLEALFSDNDLPSCSDASLALKLLWLTYNSHQCVGVYVWYRCKWSWLWTEPECQSVPLAYVLLMTNICLLD